MNLEELPRWIAVKGLLSSLSQSQSAQRSELRYCSRSRPFLLRETKRFFARVCDAPVNFVRTDVLPSQTNHAYETSHVVAPVSQVAGTDLFRIRNVAAPEPFWLLSIITVVGVYVVVKLACLFIHEMPIRQ